MASFGELVLVLGDAHVPDRASKIAEGFQRMLVPNKMQHVICTGNCHGGGILEQLQGLAPNVHLVASGDSNDVSDMLPEYRIVKVGAFRIGVIHGHQIVPYKDVAAVDRWRRKLNVDVIITGHTHQNQFRVCNDGRNLHINPGSITGAYSSLTPTATPSFCLLAIQQTKLTCYTYELINDEVEVNSTTFSKPELESESAANPELMASLLA